MARASGSYPAGHRFKSHFRHQIRPVGQAVKTRPFHGCNMGSIPVRVTKPRKSTSLRCFFLFRGLVARTPSSPPRIRLYAAPCALFKFLPFFPLIPFFARGWVRESGEERVKLACKRRGRLRRFRQRRKSDSRTKSTLRSALFCMVARTSRAHRAYSLRPSFLHLHHFVLCRILAFLSARMGSRARPRARQARL